MAFVFDMSVATYMFSSTFSTSPLMPKENTSFSSSPDGFERRPTDQASKRSPKYGNGLVTEYVTSTGSFPGSVNDESEFIRTSPVRLCDDANAKVRGPDLAHDATSVAMSATTIGRRRRFMQYEAYAYSNSAATYSSGSNATKSWAPSPIPTSLTGIPISVSMANTMPPLAEPSSFVSTTPVTSVAAANSRA